MAEGTLKEKLCCGGVEDREVKQETYNPNQGK